MTLNQLFVEIPPLPEGVWSRELRRQELLDIVWFEQKAIRQQKEKLLLELSRLRTTAEIWENARKGVNLYTVEETSPGYFPS